MPCYHANNLTICRPEPMPDIMTIRRFFRCPTCKRRRLCDVLYYEWYGPMAKCRKCGKSIVLGY